MTIFDIDHVFVAFAPGSGGNFVAGLLSSINSGNLTDLPISQSGSSHVVKNGKADGADSISFGSNPEENLQFASVEAKEDYYLKRINEEYIKPSRVITWTHDYSNLVLYKKHFKKSRTLSITCHNPEEKLISIFMHVNKVILSDESDIPILKNLWDHLKSRLKFHLGNKLRELISTDVDVDTIFNNRCGEYKDLIFYLSTCILLNYSALDDALSLIGEPKIEFQNRRLLNIREIILQNSDVILPYSYLRENNVTVLTNSIAKLFGRPLTSSEIEYVTNTFSVYRNKQDSLLLSDPVDYFHQRKKVALETINRLKALHDN